MRISFIPILLTLSACGGGNYTPQANRPPVADAGPAQTVTAPAAIKLAGSGSDPDQDIITYAWTLTRPASSQASLLNYHYPSPTFVADVPGVYVATLVVNDGKLDSAPSSVTITAQ